MKRLLAFLLSVALALSVPVSAFAAADGSDIAGLQDGMVTTQTSDASEWTSEDFTYGPYEKLLYGCDYTRQITIRGVAITGFSESGTAKLAENKDLVLPAVDDEGNTIVAVGDRAFYGMGLTSVTFPTGMMVEYDDTITNKVTKRGNLIVGNYAFANNELTEVILPEGVIACLPGAFQNNLIETVKLPRTIWWLETMAFAQNRITTVNFPTTCDFQLEMHGLTFARNFIKSVRLPDFTEVVNKDVFAWNTGSEPLADDLDNENYRTYTLGGQSYTAGVVYMYTDNAELEAKDRIHHTGKATESQHSDVQKLVVNDGTEATQDPSLPWNINDFTVEGTVITGLSASGEAKRATNKDLVIPDMTADYQYVTEIAAAEAGGNGLFGSETEGFDSVYLPSELRKVGNFAFQNCGIKEVTFSPFLEEIGISAFAMNELTSVILPDTVTTLGGGAFATNPKLERISLSKSLTEIPAGAFGCSDQNNWMENLTSIEIPEGITSIGANAFAGNNFHEIVIPASVKSIGNYAFSTKNYLMDPCTLTLNEGLETIGSYAFRNKIIDEVVLPTTVTKLPANTFTKEYSDDTVGIVTKVYVSLQSQYDDKTNFPDSDYQKIYLTNASVWTAEDFTYEEEEFTVWPANEYSSKPNFTAWVVSGFSESGLEKIETNKDLVIPATDPDGRTVQGVASSAFYRQGITSVKFPEGVKAAWDDSTWTTTGQGVTERGDFFIGSSAFGYNALTTLELPDGVLYVGNNAFKGNDLVSVKLPKSLMQIAQGAFATNEITSVEFPEKTDFAFQVDAQAFAQNQIKAVQIPSNTEKLTDLAFFQNTGMEPVVNNVSGANSNMFKNEQKGGIVYVYKTEAGGSFIDHYDAKSSNTQKLIIGTIPNVDAPWGVGDFTYDGTVITGLSDTGKEKIQSNANLILPDVNPNGEAITGIGNSTNTNPDTYANIGTFGYYADGTAYVPTGIILPDTLKSIGRMAFASSKFTQISLPDGLETIDMAAFQNGSLTAVSLPDSVTTLGSGAFTGNGSLTSVKLSAGLKEIPSAAFSAGAATTMAIGTLVIPEGVESIGANAFSGAHVENLTLPSTLETIGSNAFMNHKLTELVIPDRVTEIGSAAFRVTEEAIGKTLSSLTLGKNLQSIGTRAFGGSALITVDLPSGIQEIADNAFVDGTEGVVILRTSNEALLELNTEEAMADSHVIVYDKLVGSGWTAEDFTYDEETGTITGWSESGQAKRKDLKTLVLPDKTPGGKDVVAIGTEAFKIPDNEVIVTKFGIDSPNGMTSVNLPVNLVRIGDRAFSQNALTAVDLTGLQAIGESAFYGNKLAKVELPDTVTEMGSGAFATNNITELKLSAGLTVIPQGAFSMNIWLEHVEIPNSVTEIGETAFAGARLTSLTIPESVVKIGDKAFHLHHLTELTIPGNVKWIGDSAFEGTYKATTLKTLVIEEGVEHIGRYAFKEALLETVHFPNSIKEVGEQPFLNNAGKDGSHVVEVTTYNRDHLAFQDDTYVVKYIGTYDIGAYADDVVLSYTSAEYTGSALEPEVTIPGLQEGVDYTVAYQNNVNPGEATVVITGIGSYEGSITKTFTITEKGGTENPPDEGETDPSKPGSGEDGGSDSPNTGDDSQLSLWLTLMLVSGGALTFIVRRRTDK